VRKADNRFTNFDNLDRSGVVVAVGQGWASETFVKARLTKAQIDSGSNSYRFVASFLMSLSLAGQM